ncbi:alginate O-acetyltransferase AlgF [Deinococcus hopiensis]|uniref:Alginate biosynthesis protein AlgF n=1 Tax=Deinococcus hopiensis KR-140 TaxID=695939 RepID=A0A1W1UHG8_9DEIO|nr:alginate O-acetyltransferase AlgF [Deinococcus hopiensis]SMB80546.1 alginate O-acetyltransferase complex protein AlgF [Deinococcus hopiensis KR-140]
MKNFTLFVALLGSLAAAEDNGLYDPAPPANSAFVRVINAPAGTLGGKAVTADKGTASVYVVVPQGEFDAKVGAAAGKLKVEAGKFYSVVPSGNRLVLLTDPAMESRAKALLVIYNLSKAASVDLKTADGKTTVVKGVKAGDSGNRAVNGVTVDLAAFAGDKALGTLKGVKLERGNTYAVVVTDGGVTLTMGSTKTK